VREDDEGLWHRGGVRGLKPSNSCQESGAHELAALHLMLSRQSSRFKGVVPQPNGRWGAQIYERHARVWLGTFATADEAALAYDKAALRMRGPRAHLNFPLDVVQRELQAAEAAAAAGDGCAETTRVLRRKRRRGNHDAAADDTSHGSVVAAATGRDPTMVSFACAKKDQGTPPSMMPERSISDPGAVIEFEDIGGEYWDYLFT